jgi:hypothetical protein
MASDSDEVELTRVPGGMNARFIVEERQRRRCPPRAAPRRAAVTNIIKYARNPIVTFIIPGASRKM